MVKSEFNSIYSQENEPATKTDVDFNKINAFENSK
jgi:hypothetical protein